MLSPEWKIYTTSTLPKPQGIEGRRLKEVELVDNCEVILSSEHSRGAVQVKQQDLWQQAQDLCKPRLDKIKT